MTLLARGAGLRRMATAGLAKSAELEARRESNGGGLLIKPSKRKR